MGTALPQCIKGRSGEMAWDRSSTIYPGACGTRAWRLSDCNGECLTVHPRPAVPPQAHMWLEHVYGYAGMLDYTLQSNIYYTHNTGT